MASGDQQTAMAPGHQQPPYWLMSAWWLLMTWCLMSINVILCGVVLGDLFQMLSLQYRQVSSLRPGDAIWQHRSGSTLAQVMACCLTTPSHYLNQCWLIISEVLRHSRYGNFTGNAVKICILNMSLKIANLITEVHLPEANVRPSDAYMRQ